MQKSARSRRWMKFGVGLALVVAPGFSVVSCGDDDEGDDDPSNVDGGLGDHDGGHDAGIDGGPEGGSGGGRAGSGGTGGSDDDGGADDDAGEHDDASVSSFRSVTINMTAMDPHVGQMMHFRVMSAGAELVALGVLDPLAAADTSFVLPNSTPEGTHRLDFFADFNENGAYDVPPDDHAWRRDIPADDVLAFMHNTTFADISMPTVTEGDTFTFTAESMSPHMGQSFELRVIELPSLRVVGRYVLTEITDPTFTLELPGIIADDTMYQVDFTADMNENGMYDAPPTDHAWRTTGESESDGLTVEFTHNTEFTDVQF